MIPDIRTKIINDPTLSAIVGNRVFHPKPIKEQTESYISFKRANRPRYTSGENQEFKFFVFSKDTSEIETIADALISLFEGNQIESANTYKIIMLNQTDGDGILDNGFYWSILDFRFQRVV